MRCETALEQLDDYIGAELLAPDRVAVAAHLQHCSECSAVYLQRLQLLADLHQLPAIEPREEFLESALTRAAASAPRQSFHYPLEWRSAAAGVVLTALVVLLWGSGRSTPESVAALPSVQIALHEVSQVSLLLDSKGSYQQAAFSIELPEGVEVAGYPQQRSLQWRGDLKAGKNLLKLPLIANSGRGGELIARVRHGNGQSVIEYRLQLSARRDSGV